MITGKSTSDIVFDMLKTFVPLSAIIAWFGFWIAVIYAVFKLAQHFWNN